MVMHAIDVHLWEAHERCVRLRDEGGNNSLDYRHALEIKTAFDISRMCVLETARELKLELPDVDTGLPESSEG